MDCNDEQINDGLEVLRESLDLAAKLNDDVDKITVQIETLLEESRMSRET